MRVHVSRNDKISVAPSQGGNKCERSDGRNNAKFKKLSWPDQLHHSGTRVRGQVLGQILKYLKDHLRCWMTKGPLYSFLTNSRKTITDHLWILKIYKPQLTKSQSSNYLLSYTIDLSTLFGLQSNKIARHSIQLARVKTGLISMKQNFLTESS